MYNDLEMIFYLVALSPVSTLFCIFMAECEYPHKTVYTNFCSKVPIKQFSLLPLNFKQ